MSSINIYEDQENRVPLSLHDRGITHKYGENSGHNQHNNNIGLVQTQSIKSNVLQNKRTVLSSININSSVRVQPRRAAKHGVSYESGIPFHQTDENATEKTKSFSSTSSAVPSFRIHEDSSCSSFSSTTSSSSSISSWNLGALRPLAGSSSSSSSSSESSVAAAASAAPSVAAEGSSVLLSSSRPKLRPIKVDANQSPVKNRLRGKTKTVEGKSLKPTQNVETPEAMDISVTDGGSCMTVDTPSGVVNLPREDILDRKDNSFDLPEYAEDIYNYLREAEICHKPSVNYMRKQADITASMRWILVDWLVEVSEEYSLHTETLYLAVSYIDRFLSYMSVKRDKLQLVGTTAMFIASKYEEIYPPDVSQFAYITDNTYRVSQIIRMEHLILKILSFDMAIPTALVFVNYFSRICKCDEETLHLAMFISELSMLDSDPFLRFLPSKIAASSIALANFTQGREAWPEVAVTKTSYCLDDLRECYVNLHRSFCRVNEPSDHAIREKYKATKWHSVSLLSPREKFPW